MLLSAIRAGKHLVTANKALLATHGVELFDAPRAAGVTDRARGQRGRAGLPLGVPALVEAELGALREAPEARARRINAVALVTADRCRDLDRPFQSHPAREHLAALEAFRAVATRAASRVLERQESVSDRARDLSMRHPRPRAGPRSRPRP